jgi:hypothetical protein
MRPMRPSRHLIIANKTGQVGNRLVLYAHMLAAGYERGWRVLNPSFGEYADLFVGTRGRLATVGPELPNARHIARAERQAFYRLNRVGYEAAKLLHRLPGSGVGWAKAADVLHYDLDELLTRAEHRGWRVVFTQNYHFRQHAWVARHAARIKPRFVPVEPHRGSAEARVAEARTRGAVLVGVHIRHGDYRHHLGGKFFYHVPQYVALMRQLVALHAPRAVSFLVCSNAQHQADDFADLTVTPGPSHLASDLHALSLCDVIVGPPSSFSAWAAFAGGARHHMVEDPARPLALSDFVVPASPDPKY